MSIEFFILHYRFVDSCVDKRVYSSQNPNSYSSTFMDLLLYCLYFPRQIGNMGHDHVLLIPWLDTLHKDAILNIVIFIVNCLKISVNLLLDYTN